MYRKESHNEVTKTLGQLTVSLSKLSSTIDENPGKVFRVFVFLKKFLDQKIFGLDNKIDCIVRKFSDRADENYQLSLRKLKKESSSKYSTCS